MQITLQKYTKFFDFRSSNCENHINGDEFSYFFDFGTRKVVLIGFYDVAQSGRKERRCSTS